jgi:predicted CXXCH cytochrome family protein
MMLRNVNRQIKTLLSISIAALLIAGIAAGAEDKFKLKPGARGKVCLTCHTAFEEKLKNPFVHTPVKMGDCTGCHNPHASSHGKLLSTGVNNICAKCHKTMIPENALSAHPDVVSGNCTKCHDAHSSKNKANLVNAGNTLCFGCHKEMGATLAKVKFRHNPVEKGCITCHNPHASASAQHLLIDLPPALCLKCHRADNPTFTKLHMNYPVSKGNCTSCHDVHGSDKGALLYTNAHVPVANRLCNQCHEEPGSATPFKTKKKGFELCRGCHNDMVNETLSRNTVHWPLLGKDGCLNCHNPHGSKGKKLLRGPLPSVCGKCHADTMERFAKSPTKHQPVLEGNCAVCHEPHSSNFSYLGRKQSIELCGSCHNWKAHTSHPIGDAAVDKRNSNLQVECLSCHRSHGTEFKKMLIAKTPTDLCNECHKEHKR